MAQSVTITLTTAGPRTGPFNLYSNIDNYAIPFETGVSRTNLLAGYVSTTVPDGATIIRVVSIFDCISFVDLSISGVTTTTTTTTSTTTTTTTLLPARINWVNTDYNTGVYIDSDLYLNGSLQGGGIDGSGYIEVSANSTVLTGQNSGNSSGVEGAFRLIIKNTTNPATLYNNVTNATVSEYQAVQTTNFTAEAGNIYDVTASVQPSSLTTTSTTSTSTTSTTTTSPLYTLIGTGTKIVGATDCTSNGSTPNIYLNAADYTKYVDNGSCFSNLSNTNRVSTIRYSDGTPIDGTFYFVWYGDSCPYSTFLSTNGTISYPPGTLNC
jgi:hypothetical protein